MISNIQESDLWSFGELYSVLTVFADDPTKAIIRIGGARISIPEDQANHLDHYYNLLIAKYPDAADLAVMKVVGQIDAILDRKSRGGESFDEWFWSNAGFERHPDWITIRELSREFLLR
jgi:hypothetical protein